MRGLEKCFKSEREMVFDLPLGESSISESSVDQLLGHELLDLD
jgi:hypothetical protein